MPEREVHDLGRMRRVLVLLVSALGAALLAASAASGRAGAVATVKIPLPPAGSERVAAIAVTSAAAPKPVVTNAAKLGSAQMNTQVVAAVRTGKTRGTYVIYVFIHRFPPARRVTYAEEFADLYVKAAKVDHFVANIGCDHGNYDFTGKFPMEGLKQNGFYDDSWTTKKTFASALNEVPAFDTDTEEQIDNVVHAQCPLAEGDDPGSK
jgi:hypothetical protein